MTRTFTYWMGVAALATASMTTACSDDAGDDVAEAPNAGSGGMTGDGGAAGDGGSAGEAMGGDGGSAGARMSSAGAGGMANMAGAGGMGVGNGSGGGSLDAGVDAGEGPDSGVDAGGAVVAQSVLFSELYQPIFTRCTGCHFGSYGAAEDAAYTNVTANLTTVVNRLASGSMPAGCVGAGNCLTDDEMADIEAWVAAGAPR